MSVLTYNTPLVFGSAEEEKAVFEVLEAQRLAYNECSRIKFFNKLKNSLPEVHDAFYHGFRAAHPEIPSQVVIKAEQDVLAAYRSIKKNKHVVSAPARKRHLSMRLDKRIFSHKNGVFSIVTFGQRAKCRPHLYPKLEELLKTYKFLDPLLFVRGGKIWIALSFEIGETLSPQTLACGVDLGVRVAAATSEGRLYVDKPYRARRRKVRKLKRQLQSRGTKSARRKLKALRRKERNQSKDFTYRLVNRVLADTKADVVVIEDLKGLTAGKRGKKATKQVPFAETRRVLEHKAALLAKPKTVIAVKPHFTSQIDSQTGKKSGERRGRRFYAANGCILDADVNAAINIATRSKLPCSYSYLPNGEKRLLAGQAEVTRPIAS